MESELLNALGGPLDQHFATFDHEPIAAASIGQVYAATLHDGRKVAVKVQYPGIQKALESDLKNIKTIVGTLAAAIPKLDVGKFAQDFLARVADECDYTREAEHQATFARVWQGDATIVIPAVVPELTRRNVLVTEFVAGQTFAELSASADQSEKDLAAETLFRFVFHSIELHGLFNADPHPGNYVFLGGGKVAFLDFGCVQAYDPEARLAFVSLRDAALAGKRGDDFWAAFAKAMVFRKEIGAEVRQTLVEYSLFTLEPVLATQPFRFTPDYTAKISEKTLKLNLTVTKSLLKEGWSEPRRDGIVHLGRIVFGLYSLLAELRAEQNWLKLLPER